MCMYVRSEQISNINPYGCSIFKLKNSNLEMTFDFQTQEVKPRNQFFIFIFFCSNSRTQTQKIILHLHLLRSKITDISRAYDGVFHRILEIFIGFIRVVHRVLEIFFRFECVCVYVLDQNTNLYLHVCMISFFARSAMNEIVLLKKEIISGVLFFKKQKFCSRNRFRFAYEHHERSLKTMNNNLMYIYLCSSLI